MSARPTRRHRRPVLFAAALLLLLMLAPAAPAQYSGPAPILKQQTIYNAYPDACFGPSPGNHSPNPPPCPAGMTPKYNMDYAFGFTQYGTYGYFGSGQNIPCNIFYWGVLQPWSDDSAVCEYGKGVTGETLGPTAGDTSPTHMFRIDSTTDTVQEITPKLSDFPGDPAMQAKVATALDYLSRMNPGTRAAAAGPPGSNVVMYFGGLINNVKGDPAFGRTNSLAAIAVDATTGKLLDVVNLTTVIGMRVGTVLNGHTYVAARTPSNIPGVSGGGVVMKWLGSYAAPFSGGPQNNGFETILVLNNHEGTKNDPNHIGTFTDANGGDHLVLAGINNINGDPTKVCPGSYVTDGQGSKVWISPVVPKTGDGLTAASDPGWHSIFAYKQYDPDPIRGLSQYFGYLYQFDGQLVVGTYATPPLTTFTEWCHYNGFNASTYPVPTIPANFRTKLRDFANAEHAVSVFAIKNPDNIGGKQSVRLLYGDKKLPVFDGKTWKYKTNLLGQTPKFGRSGFGNALNMYNWTWAVMQNKLYMGTFDASIPGNVFTPAVAQIIHLTDRQEQFMNLIMDFANKVRKEQGGDLVRLDNLSRPGALEDIHGYGNQFHYGTRSLFVFGNKMYAGGSGAYNRKAAFSIVKLTAQPQPVGPVVRRAVGERVMEVAMTVARAGLGAVPAQASSSTVRAGERVNFRVRLKNNGPLPATRSRVCVRLPRGFSLGSNPGAVVRNREVCVTVGTVKARGSRTVVIHATAPASGETAAAVANGSGSELTGDPACDSATGQSGPGALGEIASAGGRAAQATSTDPCPDLATVSAADQNAMLNDFRVFAKPKAVGVRVAAARTGGVTG